MHQRFLEHRYNVLITIIMSRGLNWLFYIFRKRTMCIFYFWRVLYGRRDVITLMLSIWVRCVRQCGSLYSVLTSDYSIVFSSRCWWWWSAWDGINTASESSRDTEAVRHASFAEATSAPAVVDVQRSFSLIGRCPVAAQLTGGVCRTTVVLERPGQCVDGRRRLDVAMVWGWCLSRCDSRQHDCH